MNKKDVQRKYNQVKSEKAKAASMKTLLGNVKPSGGCATCGKVTWKPKKSS
jgi:hypothetical protein